jgi:CRISPR-associated protein Cmr5
MQTRNQKLAIEVFRRIEGLQKEGKPESDQKKYGSVAHKLPILIRSAGLAQALAFVDAKGQGESGKMHKRLLDDLASVLMINSRDNMIKRSREAGIQEYLRLTQQSMAALLWFKRYAQSVLGVEASQDLGGRS